jgi:hypothetical protein
MMLIDPIVEEIHEIRRQIAEECDFDMDKIFEMLKKMEAEHPERMARDIKSYSERMGRDKEM